MQSQNTFVKSCIWNPFVTYIPAYSCVGSHWLSWSISKAHFGVKAGVHPGQIASSSQFHIYMWNLIKWMNKSINLFFKQVRKVGGCISGRFPQPKKGKERVFSLHWQMMVSDTLIDFCYRRVSDNQFHHICSFHPLIQLISCWHFALKVALQEISLWSELVDTMRFSRWMNGIILLIKGPMETVNETTGKSRPKLY